MYISLDRQNWNKPKKKGVFVSLYKGLAHCCWTLEQEQDPAIFHGLLSSPWTWAALQHFTESQDWGRKKPLEVTSSNPYSSRANYSRLPMSKFRQVLNISKETLEPLRATCASAPSSTQRRSTSWQSEGTSRVLVCAHSLLSYHWALCTHPSGINTHWWDLPEPPHLQAEQPQLSASPHRRGSPVPSSSWWHSVGLSPICPCHSCTGEPSTGPSTPGVASPVLSREIQKFTQLLDWLLHTTGDTGEIPYPMLWLGPYLHLCEEWGSGKPTHYVGSRRRISKCCFEESHLTGVIRQILCYFSSRKV